MKVFHFHFGKDGGAETFFVHLIGALGRREVEQLAVIRKQRAWRTKIAPYAEIIESNFRNLSIDRLALPLKVRALAREHQPEAIMSWATRGSRLMPPYRAGITLSRLGDYPTHLGYFRNTDVLICNTPGIADHVRRIGWTRGVEVISNFTATEPVPPAARTDLNTPADAPVVMAMGRFVKRKGLNILIEAAALVPDIYLWIAGDGEELPALEALVAERGLAHRTRFLGWRQDTRPFVAAADLFVMPSFHEPLGNVILEAWAQKRPVISTRSEGPSWFMTDEENGLLVPIADKDALAGAISRLLTDASLRRGIAEAGHKALIDRFSEEAVAGAYLDLFKRRPAWR
ncbi:glycosyltransferase [Rhizobium sp. YIM 134829]|uniref:glycosyltransferase n=1 Tax=Rhizobium sp. YIM 134829 TaxID=3390453 RepID=UPI00397E1E61